MLIAAEYLLPSPRLQGGSPAGQGLPRTRSPAIGSAASPAPVTVGIPLWSPCHPDGSHLPETTAHSPEWGVRVQTWQLRPFRHSPPQALPTTLRAALPPPQGHLEKISYLANALNNRSLGELCCDGSFLPSLCNGIIDSKTTFLDTPHYTRNSLGEIKTFTTIQNRHHNNL